MNVYRFMIMLCICTMTACGGKSSIKEGADSRADRQSSEGAGKGGYYLDDGPGDNPPADIDSIPDAVPKAESLLGRANQPYTALGKKYVPMTSYAPYVKQGIASWYGKRYHGKKTSSGEIYDMYSMTGAHPTLPIPSYVRVTNPANKRSVIVRINDRGPFKHDRLIDLSFAAAYKLRITSVGSAPVEVAWIDTSSENAPIYDASAPVAEPGIKEMLPTVTQKTPEISATNNTEFKGTTYYVQVGAFKNELNGELLQKKILGLDLAGDAAVTNVYNDGLYRVKLGPFATRKEADLSAGKVRKQLNLSAIVTNQ